MTQVRLWTILGESQSGKSTAIKTLLSRQDGGPPGFRNVLLRDGGHLAVIGKVMAWQENEKDPDQSVAEILAWAQGRQLMLGGTPPAFINVLSALRFDAITKVGNRAYPSGKAYLERWLKEGWTIESLVLMSPDANGTHDFYGTLGAPTLWHRDARSQSLGNMVGAIRNHFGWA